VKLCLMNPGSKARYDAALRIMLAGGAPKEQPAPGSTDVPKEEAPCSPPEQARAWVIGSAPDCDLVVDQPAVSQHHCRLTQTPRGCFLEDLGSTNGTFLNGRKLTSRMVVCVADTIRLGQNVPLPWPKAIPVSKMRIIRIGAAQDNDVILDLPMVSGHHALIRVDGDVATIEDLGSTNGTAIGASGKKISQATLMPGDVVYLGSHGVPASKLLAGA